MYSILLVIIYLSFISLGLPDGLLGSAWPSMYKGLQVPMSYAGILSMIIAGGTILSSLFSNRLIKKLGTGKVTAISVCMTAIALFGFSMSNSFVLLCFWGIPYGLGAGSVDAALNNFVAIHYKAKHMSWLHCFWGIGATLGPYIMGFCLTNGMRWTSGYQFVFIIQIVLTAILIFSMPLWRKSSTLSTEELESSNSLTMIEILRKPGAKQALITFFAYCSLESTTGLWGSSYMVIEKGLTPYVAAKWISLFYLGITIGRFLSGFITGILNGKNMVRLGQVIIMIGILTLFLPLGNGILCVSFILIGLGCAPIYPSLIHATPDNFGKDVSQALMGMQMASAYVGTTFMPPLFGALADNISIKLFPFFLFVFVILMICMVERMNRIVSRS
ncbi:MFS transporter [Anaeromicropila herbilytica]|uniref:MFS transporter n=1 Tax=Anaeromicropila herbilytica TaxID=2785025 RepID=A0A7R7IDJ9_9FIRM|nr:MFS transporter [Anaeromicropila herbilytica]BCN31788.1 MFS transporter [Anaeromicropila herbilytica]